MQDFDYKKGDLVLVRNTAIEKSLNRKMRPRYFGLMIVISRNRGGAYIICDLDGTLSHAPVAVFRVVPYLTRKNIEVPDLEQHINISVNRLRELKWSITSDPNEQDVVSAVIEDIHSNSDREDSDKVEA